MNSTNFIQTGGWPLDAERLQEMQTAYSIFNSLGALAGNFSIISGCTLTGSVVGNGFVYINGELLDFKEATVTPDSTVIIIEESVNRGFKNGNIKQVHTIRYATFGTSETSWLWTAFKKVDPLIVIMAKITELEKKTAIFKPGGVAFPWFKPANEIPEGFQEVLDMRGRTIIGYDPTQTEFNLIGKKSGAKTANGSVVIPISGWGTGGGNVQGNPSGKILVSSGENEDGEYLESINKASSAPAISTTVSTLSPYKIAMYIEYAE